MVLWLLSKVTFLSGLLIKLHRFKHRLAQWRSIHGRFVPNGCNPQWMQTACHTGIRPTMTSMAHAWFPWQRMHSTGAPYRRPPIQVYPNTLGQPRSTSASETLTHSVGRSWRHSYAHGATYQGPLQRAYKRVQRPPTGGPRWMGRRRINAQCEKSLSDRSPRAAVPCPLKPASCFRHPSGSLDAPADGFHSLPIPLRLIHRRQICQGSGGNALFLSVNGHTAWRFICALQ